jgi:hypothetical protein
MHEFVWYLWPLADIIPLLIVEALAVVGIAGCAAVMWKNVRLRALTGPFARLARRRWLCVGLLGLLAGGGSAALSTFVYDSQPRIHDEFSYILAADTFAHGRLTNPSHPFWVHFETFHVFHTPTYMSKYPPGQGLTLAAGQALGGHPRVGIWLGMALMGAAVCWMLQGWLSPRWALAAALLLVGRLVLASPDFKAVGYWGHSYQGGAVAAMGGALLFGALRRLARRPTFGLAGVLGLGLVVLANTRPFEGFVVSLPAAVVLLGILLRQGRAAAVRVVPGVLAVLVPGALAMAAYNAALTGDPLKLPYVHHEQIYTICPQFLWQPLRPEPVYNHEVIRSFFIGYGTESYREQHTWAGVFLYQLVKGQLLWLFFLGSAQTVAVLGLFAPTRDRWTRFALVVCGLLVLAFVLEQGIAPHYAAPATCLVGFLVIQGLRHLRHWRVGQRAVGRSLVPGLVLVIVLVWSFSLRFAIAHDQSDLWHRDRARLTRQLEQTPGRHLVLVRYAPDHNEHWEWVYNGADLDAAQVVWARELGGEPDRALRTYYADRTVWLLEADLRPPRLTRSPTAGRRVDSPARRAVR